MNQDRIRILLVEDHFLARMALRSILDGRTDMTIAGESSDGLEAPSQYRKLRPDVTIMDLRLPGATGIEAIRAIRAFDPGARIVVLSNYDRSEDVYQALQAGALAYLVKDTSGEELIRAIQNAHCGRRYLPEAVGRRLAERVSTDQLTAREREVLQLLAQGMSNRRIGERLAIAEKTVRTHVSSILDKMQVTDRTQAVITAFQRGMIHIE